MSEPITYRAGLRRLDTGISATYEFRSSTDLLTVTLNTDRFESMGRPGWIEVVVTPINDGQR